MVATGSIFLGFLASVKPSVRAQNNKVFVRKCPTRGCCSVLQAQQPNYVHAISRKRGRRGYEWHYTVFRSNFSPAGDRISISTLFLCRESTTKTPNILPRGSIFVTGKAIKLVESLQLRNAAPCTLCIIPSDVVFRISVCMQVGY